MISSCLNKREVIKVFSVGRRLALLGRRGTGRASRGWKKVFLLVGGQFIGGCNEPIKMH